MTNLNIEVEVPDGIEGDYTVSTFEVSEEEARMYNLRASIRDCRFITPGIYKKLSRKGFVVMSNTPSEVKDHISFIEKAQGRVLINGLGLGMVLKAILKKEDLVAVTVVEVSPEVIKLTGPTYTVDPRVEIVNASAFDYKPPKGRHYNAVWHDIWDDLCGDNVMEMNRLHRKYSKCSDWQGSWCRRECLKLNRRRR